MSERDLIERRWIGQRAGQPAKATGMERVAEIWRDQGLTVTEWVPAATIARLSEALAEAEKKGGEAYEEAARIAESFINPNAFTREQQAASDTAGNIADMILFNAPPRNLSQGGQHG